MAIDRHLRELRFGDFVDTPVDAGEFGVRPVDAAGAALDLLARQFGIELRDSRLNRVDRILELPQAFAVAGEHRHGQRLHLFGNLALQHRERRFALGGDEHAPAGGEVVADDVGDRVRLAGAGRPLHRDPLGLFELLDDGDLLLIVGQREEQLPNLAAAAIRGAAGQSPEADVLERRRLVRRQGDECGGAFRNVASVRQPLLEPLQVVEQIVVRAGPREERPGIGHDKMLARRWHGFVFCRYGTIDAPALHVGGDELQKVGKGAGIERRDGALLIQLDLLTRRPLDLDGNSPHAACERIALVAGIGGSRAQTERHRRFVDPDLHLLRQKRILEIDSGNLVLRLLPRQLPACHANPPDQLGGPGGLFGFELVLDGKQRAVEIDGLTARFFTLGPCLPERGIVVERRVERLALLPLQRLALFRRFTLGGGEELRLERSLVDGRPGSRRILAEADQRFVVLAGHRRLVRFESMDAHPEVVALHVDVKLDARQADEIGAKLEKSPGV